jgi:hypothetical protein
MMKTGPAEANSGEGVEAGPEKRGDMIDTLKIVDSAIICARQSDKWRKPYADSLADLFQGDQLKSVNLMLKSRAEGLGIK